MEKKEIFILGVGNNTIVFIDLVEACGYKVAGLYHYNNDRTGENVHGYPIIDSNTNLFKEPTLKGKNFAISVGDNKIRTDLACKIRKKFGTIPTLIHPTALVSRFARIAPGVAINANSVVQANVEIGQDTVVSYNVSITHTSHIGCGCYIAVGSNIGAFVKIQDNVFVGQAATIVSGKVKYIGSGAIIGAGSTVIKNVAPNTVVAGNPAKKIKTSL